jgi:FAD/FMN-containing dehydrogenase
LRHEHRSHLSLAAALRDGGFVGRLVEPGDRDYDEARAGWNGAIDRRPSAVAYALDPDDVSVAVRALRTIGMPFTVRSGGHSVSGRSVRDGALCLDLRGLNDVTVDGTLVSVGGGALLGEVDMAAQEHGLAVPAGHISHTGVGGLTLGGGVGWLMRKHGLTVDSLCGADVVLADGSQVRVCAESHPDLFWALRGGGGDFAIVTRFDFIGRHVGPTVLGGFLVYPWEQAHEALRASRDLMADAPDELTIFDCMVTAPPEAPFPPELQGRRVVAVTVAWCGDLDEGQQALAPLREACIPALDLVGPMPYLALQQMLDETSPHGWRFHDRLHYVDAMPDELIDALVAGVTDAPGPLAQVNIGRMGGAVANVGVGETAFGHRDAHTLVWFIGCSGDGPIEPVRDWVRRLSDETAGFATGTYVNALEDGRDPREAYRESVWERLVAVKRRYDPDGVFSGNGIG